MDKFINDMSISDTIKYIGVDDLTLDLFESQYVVEEGISYNSYIILDDKTCLMDTVDIRGVKEWEEKLSEAGFEPNHVEGKATGWILLDYLGVVIHIFTRDTRDYYNLDRMWDDGTKLNLDDILTSAREED